MKETKRDDAGGFGSLLPPCNIGGDPAQHILRLYSIYIWTGEKSEGQRIQLGIGKTDERVTAYLAPVCQVDMFQIGIEEGLGISDFCHLQIGLRKAKERILNQVFGSRPVIPCEVHGPPQ
jgi:hypothetical protein